MATVITTRQEDIPVRELVEQYLHGCVDSKVGPTPGFKEMGMWVNYLVESGTIDAGDLKVLFPEVVWDAE
jgi:hypothetical protein